jgi:hypothetical protein
MNHRAMLIFVAAVALLAAPAFVSAAEPTLTATVMPGKEIDVTGTDFPANADVLLAIQRNGAAAGSQTLKTDAAGAFSATIDAGPGRGGVYTMTATSGAAKAIVEALAVETAGGGGLQSSPPPTNTAPVAASTSAPVHGGTIALVALLTVLMLAMATFRRRVAQPVD